MAHGGSAAAAVGWSAAQAVVLIKCYCVNNRKNVMGEEIMRRKQTFEELAFSHCRSNGVGGGGRSSEN